MFKDAKAFSSFSVDDLQKAKDFYNNVLGLDVTETEVSEMEFLTLNFATGGKVMVYPKGESHEPATFTVLNFPVDNVEKAVEDLTKLGISFEKYDTELVKTDERGISIWEGPKMAWFKDPAGNTLSVMEENK